MDRPRMTDLLFGLVFVAVGTWVWFETRTFPVLRDGHPGPSLFPGLLAWALVACGVAVAGHGLVRPRALAAEVRSLSAPGLGWLRVAFVAFLGLLYPLFHQQLGFIPTSAALIFGVALILRAKWWLAALVTAGGTYLLYASFTRLLGVPR